MHIGCKYKFGDVLKGLEVVSEPYKISGKRDYMAKVKCVFCGREYDIVLSEINRHIFDGCGCQRDRSNSINWLSFQDWCVENNQQQLLDAWDYDFNKKSPDKVSCCTSDCYYFKCPENKHESSSWKILSLTRHGKTKTVCKKCNSFAQYAIDKFGKNVLDLYWDYDKNMVDPWIIQHASKNDIWIKCINSKTHGSYKTRPNLFLKGIGCPTCADEQQNSKLQEKVNSYLIDILHLDVLHERKCSLVAVNPRNGYKLPYDNDVLVDDNHLIIEVHGVQHYDVNNGWIIKTAKKKQVSPRQILDDLQWRDEYKKNYALSQGYHYLAIPYWTESDESYKSLIDNKIQQILNNTKLMCAQ